MRRARALPLVVALAVLVTVGLLASSALAASSSSAKSLTTLNRQVLAAINRFRTSNALAALRESNALDEAALAHSREMGLRGYFGHNSADGSPFWKRVEHYYRPEGYSSWAVGENLLWVSPTVSAAKAMQLWIASPGHLRNLMTSKWRDLGVSAVSVSAAGGVFGGHQVTIVTTDFGVRR
jgi:uncharacterized protein YkwD